MPLECPGVAARSGNPCCAEERHRCRAALACGRPGKAEVQRPCCTAGPRTYCHKQFSCHYQARAQDGGYQGVLATCPTAQGLRNAVKTGDMSGHLPNSQAVQNKCTSAPGAMRQAGSVRLSGSFGLGRGAALASGRGHGVGRAGSAATAGCWHVRPAGRSHPGGMQVSIACQ